jgi:methionyl-tRNA formyltransferase
MRILICSKRDLSAVVILNDLIEHLTHLREVTISLMLAERTRPVETIVPELIRMKALERDLPFGVFFPLIEGRSTSSAAAARALGDIIPLDELSEAFAASPPASGATPLLTLDRLMEHYGLSYEIVRGLNDQDVLAAVEAFAPDVILSARFSFRFPPAFPAQARLAAINIHPGRLPGYAGLYPHFYSMLAGEPSLGCTVHLIDEGIDSGPVLASGEVPILAGRSAFANNLDSHLLGNRLAVDIVERLIDGDRPTGKAHDGEQVKQHTYPRPEEFRAFQMKGLSLIDLREYADVLRRFGFFEELPSVAGGTPLFRSGDSDRLRSA